MSASHGALQEVQAVDVAVYRAIAATPTPSLDRALRHLTHAADHSKLWLGIAAVLAAAPGKPRRAALEGLVGIGCASAAVNIVLKRAMPRRRPDAVGAAVPLPRTVTMPGSTSFPSGHSASAFAFASAVGRELPAASLPLHLLAATVAYSRVHTGVHYPGDAVVGSLVGSASGALASRLATSLTRRWL
jgi:undecaprenyl-diphosphatase